MSDDFLLDPQLTRDFLLHNGVCPVGYDSAGAVVVVSSGAHGSAVTQDISDIYGRPVSVRDVTLEELEHTIERAVHHAGTALQMDMAELPLDSSTTDVRSLANEPPVVRYVNLIVRDAFEARASDIHLEAGPRALLARLRIDGVLVRAPEPPPGLQHAVVSRIKLVAGLDIAERRRSQDGRLRVRLDNRELDIRVSTVPTITGESVVLRLLEHGGSPLALDELAMPDSVLLHMRRFLSRSHGLVLVTGPTGSGKTTTLYAALQMRDASREKIITVEDPVEYQLPGVTQVPVLNQVGVTFATALRSILRQDPDVIMIGEIRDAETAQIGIQAAMTGHLVLATLHTNDAIGALPRLMDLGMPGFLIASSVLGVVAQRLVRRICPRCGTDTSDISRDSSMPLLATSSGYVPVDQCPHCRDTGFHGRMGIFECIAMSPRIREAVARERSSVELERLAADAEGVSMMDDGMSKAAAGMTTREEVLRVADAQ